MNHDTQKDFSLFASLDYRMSLPHVLKVFAQLFKKAPSSGYSFAFDTLTCWIVLFTSGQRKLTEKENPLCFVLVFSQAWNNGRIT